MRRVFSALLAVLATLALTAATALATPGTGAHFVTADESINSSGQLVVSFKEAGLGSYEDAVVGVTANYVAKWACQNNGGGWAPGLRTTYGDVAVSNSFEADRQGRIIGTLVAPQIWPPTDVSCPTGQNGPYLVSVSYTNVLLTDSTHDVSMSLADISKTLIVLGKSAR